MRVPQSIRDNIIYVYEGDQLLGSGFLVGIPLSPGSRNVFVYVVTARHLVEGADPIIIGMNSIKGDAIKIDTAPDTWWHSENPAADVAVAFLPPNQDDFRPTVTRPDQIADDEFLVERDVGAGDEVAFVGLFQRSPGKSKNLPIARFGHIARMNEELLPQETLAAGVQDVDAIMVEARSWGGHSGSPAYVLFTPTRWMGRIDIPKPPIEPRTTWALLGLVSGHWELPSTVRLTNAPRGRDPDREAMVNAGIALVVPGQHILDLLFRDDVVADRDRRERLAKESEGAATQDATIDEEAPDSRDGAPEGQQ